MITYSVKLNFNDDNQKNYWLNLLEVSTEIYNYISSIVKKENIKPSIKFVHDRCYYEVREKYPEVPSQIIIKIEQEVIASYKSRNTAVRRKLQEESDKPSVKSNLSLRLDRALYSNLSKDSIKLSSGEFRKRLEVKLNLYPKIEELFDNYTYHDPLIFYKDGRFYLSISFDVPEYKVDPENESILGTDLGLRRIASTSDGKIIKGKEYLKERRKVRYLKRQLQSKAKKGSKTAKKHLKKLNKKEQNLSKTFCYEVANEILNTDKNVIVLEDLTKIKKNTSKTENGYKRKKHNNRLSQIPFYTLKDILIYKAPLSHKRVETVNPSYTSQIDYRTGLKDGVRKGCRYYASDGVVLDADVNAACNIAQRYCKHPLSFELAYDGSYKPKRQASVNKPYIVYSR